MNLQSIHTLKGTFSQKWIIWARRNGWKKNKKAKLEYQQQHRKNYASGKRENVMLFTQFRCKIVFVVVHQTCSMQKHYTFHFSKVIPLLYYTCISKILNYFIYTCSVWFGYSIWNSISNKHRTQTRFIIWDRWLCWDKWCIAFMACVQHNSNFRMKTNI